MFQHCGNLVSKHEHDFLLQVNLPKVKKNIIRYATVLTSQREEEYRAKQQAMNILKYIFFKCHISSANI